MARDCPPGRLTRRPIQSSWRWVMRGSRFWWPPQRNGPSSASGFLNGRSIEQYMSLFDTEYSLVILTCGSHTNKSIVLLRWGNTVIYFRMTRPIFLLYSPCPLLFLFPINPISKERRLLQSNNPLDQVGESQMNTFPQTRRYVSG